MDVPNSDRLYCSDSEVPSPCRCAMSVEECSQSCRRMNTGFLSSRVKQISTTVKRRRGDCCCNRGLQHFESGSSRRKLYRLLPMMRAEIFRNKKLVFLLVIFTRVFLTVALPTHKVRHNHDDIKPENLPKCDEVRHKRDIRHDMRLKDAETAAICPFIACLDIDESRRPVHLTQVICLEGCKNNCADRGGDYRCTQLFSHVEVWLEKEKDNGDPNSEEVWMSKNATHILVPHKKRIKQGCVCAAEKGIQAEEVLGTPNTVH